MGDREKEKRQRREKQKGQERRAKTGNCFIFLMLALIRDTIIEQTCLFHLMLSPSLEIF